MSGMSSRVSNSASEAIAHRESLERQKQKDILSETLNSINISSLSVKEKENNEESIADTLTKLLRHVKVPLSVSFLNISFAGWGKKGAITQEFLKKNQDKFSLLVIGSDLKIILRDKDVIVSPIESGDSFQLLQIIEKDLNKLELLKNTFKTQDITEVVFELFISKFSTNKYKMNISFIVRNSHALKIFDKDGKTFVRFRDDKDCGIDMSENEVWEILIGKDIEQFLVVCLEMLLRCFYKPINQGSLQSCFNFGFIVIDKTFLARHRNLFEGSGEKGIMLKGHVAESSNSVTPYKVYVKEQKQSCSSNVELDEKSPYSLRVSAGISATQNILTSVENAIAENRTVILVGRNSLDPFIADISKLNENDRLKAMLTIRDVIDKQITGRK